MSDLMKDIEGVLTETHASTVQNTHTETIGMPQIDPSSFASQLFWLTISFILFYILLSRSAIPRIHDVLEKRQHRISQDLEIAKKLTEESESLHLSYNKLLMNTKNKANKLMTEAANRIKSEQDKEISYLNSDIADKMKDAELSLDIKRQEADARVNEISENIMQKIISNISDIKLSETEISAALKGV